MTPVLGRHLVVEARPAGVKVVRFSQPDLREPLDNSGDIDDCALFQELQRCALAGLAAGEGLVLNLGGAASLTSAFLGFLLRVRASMRNRQGRLVLCALREEHRDIFEITKTRRLFTITRSEEEAILQASG